MKIVSLIPSATEIVNFLELTKSLVGVSHECDFPESVRSFPIITNSKIKTDQTSLSIDIDIKKILELGLSVYGVNAELLKNLQPEIIITQSQCSVCAVSLGELKKSLDIWLEENTSLIDLSPNSLNDILEDIKKVGKALNVEKTAIDKVNSMKQEIEEIRNKIKNVEKQNVLCIEWLNPVMIAGNWIPDLLTIINSKSLHIEKNQNSEFISTEKIIQTKADKIILMPCGFDIKKTKQELKFVDREFKKFLNGKSVYLVDGNRFFNRPGPSILESLHILCEIVHPDIFSPHPSNKRWIKL